MCLFFALVFLVLTATYLVRPAYDCDFSQRIVECDEVPVAPLVFASASGLMGIGAAVGVAVFLALGGRQTMPWIRSHVGDFLGTIRRLGRQL